MPLTVQDCYKLMCLVAPEVAQYEDGIQTLQSETAARKAATSQKEAELARQKLPIFQEIQVTLHAREVKVWLSMMQGDGMQLEIKGI